MKVVYAELGLKMNAKAIPITASLSLESIAMTGACVGDTVLITDNDLICEAEIVRDSSGRPAFRPNWDTLQDVAPKERWDGPLQELQEVSTDGW